MDRRDSESAPIIPANQVLEDSVRSDDKHEKTEGNTVPGNQSISDTDKVKKRTIRVLYPTMLVSSISFFIVISSMWPFLKSLKSDVHETFLGWATAGYSVGQLVASIIFGIWSDRRRSIEPMLISLILLIIGCVIYAYAQAFGKNGIYAVLAARVIQGLSSGNVAVSRSVASRLSTKDERAKVMALLALFQSVGYFVGPGLQAITKPVGTKGVYVPALDLYINIYTVPCYLIVILALINLVLLIIYFRDDGKVTKKKRQGEPGMLKRATSYLGSIIDGGMIVLLLFTWFTLMSSFTLSETILSPLVMAEYAWSHNEAVLYVSVYLAGAGVISTILLLITVPLSKRFRERTLLVGALFVMFVGLFLYLPWGPGYPEIKAKNGNSSKDEDNEGGCPFAYHWCHTTPLLPLPQFFLAATVVAIGYPVAVVFHNVLYSKIIGPLPQGAFMGWLSVCGSLARIAGPVYITITFQRYGLRWSFGIIVFINLITLISLVFSWKRLVPYGGRKKRRRSINSDFVTVPTDEPS